MRGCSYADETCFGTAVVVGSLSREWFIGACDKHRGLMTNGRPVSEWQHWYDPSLSGPDALGDDRKGDVNG